MKTTKIKIEIPKAAEWDAAEYFVDNLRMTAMGCVPTGIPQVVLSKAGAHTVNLNGQILTVAADRRTLKVDGTDAGVLGGDFLAALPDGERTLIFTTAGAEWLNGNSLHGGAPNSAVDISVSTETHTLTSEVIPPQKLSGTYTRTSEALQAVDCQAMVAPIAAALQRCSAAALERGLLTQPAWVAWRMVDADGRTVAAGTPQRVGTLQGSSSLTFAASKTDNTVSLSGTATLSVNAYGLKVSVARSDSAFWRRRVSVLEVILWTDCMEVSGVSGHLNIPSLTVTPRLAELDRSGFGFIASRIPLPLEGVSSTLALNNYGKAIDSSEIDLKASTVLAAGTLNAYAIADEPGVLGIASADEPLQITVRARVCRGEILRICSPAGAGGGWNYSRHHLLVFATDGIFAVSIDGALSKIAATPLNGEGISRADAVTVAPDAIYVASSSGNLLKIKGARVERLTLPLSVLAACWCNTFGELWLLGADGKGYVLDSAGRLSARTVISISRFIEPAMAADIPGALHDLARETAAAAVVSWRRRIYFTGNALEHRVQWLIDAADTHNLSLTLAADNGGEPQRLSQLTVSGPINAPLTSYFRAPRRTYLTASLVGPVRPAARLRNVDVVEAGLCPAGGQHRSARRDSWLSERHQSALQGASSWS